MLKKFITLIINWAKTYTIKIFDHIIQLYNELIIFLFNYAIELILVWKCNYFNFIGKRTIL